MCLLSGLLESFLHCCQFLNLIWVFWLLDCLNLDDKAITCLDIHSLSDLNLFCILWFLLVFGLLKFLNLLPWVLGLRSCLHCFFLCTHYIFLIHFINCLFGVHINFSLEEPACLLLDCLGCCHSSNKKQNCYAFLHFQFSIMKLN